MRVVVRLSLGMLLLASFAVSLLFGNRRTRTVVPERPGAVATGQDSGPQTSSPPCRASARFRRRRAVVGLAVDTQPVLTRLLTRWRDVRFLSKADIGSCFDMSHFAQSGHLRPLPRQSILPLRCCFSASGQQ